MAPSPENNNAPKAPDKSDTNKCETDIISDSAKEKDKDEKTLSNLNDGELKALLDEAINYKNPKDREGKSKLFKDLLTQAEETERIARATSAGGSEVARHYNTSARHQRRAFGGGDHRQSHPHGRHQRHRKPSSISENVVQGGSLDNLAKEELFSEAASRRRGDETKSVSARQREGGLTALCILLKRLAYPNRLSDICHMFSLSPQSLSQIIKKTVELMVENHGRLLNNLNQLGWLNQERLQNYAQAVQDKGGAIHNCWGFIDGTARQICRPTVQQEEYYSGHKRNHCVKYQSVLCPDGIIVSLMGGYAGRRHDAGIFRESRLYEQLEIKVVFNDEQRYTLYGDQAYGLMELLLCPYPGRPQNLPEYQRQFNNSMKVLRVAVEWGFQKIVSEFAFVDFKKNQKLLLQDVEALYKTAVILTNCHTCLYGSQTANYFNIQPPTLEEYFGM